MPRSDLGYISQCNNSLLEPDHKKDVFDRLRKVEETVKMRNSVSPSIERKKNHNHNSSNNNSSSSNNKNYKNRNTFHSSTFANSTNDNNSTTMSITPSILKISGITSSITRELAPPSDKIRHDLFHRRMISIMGAPELLYIPKDRFSSEESPLEKPLNTFITAERNEPIASSPFDFRDLIDKYYEESEEDDTDEDEHYGDDELDENDEEGDHDKSIKVKPNDERKRINEEMISKIRKREAAVKEILTTETTYINGLDKCVEYFLKPLRDKSNHKNSLLSKPIASMDELSSLFGNIEQILSLHVQLLKSLEERYFKWSPGELISDIFLQNAPFLKMYTYYLKNFPHAIETMEKLKKNSKEFKKFLQSNATKPELGGLSFNSYLSLPIQRIPRYKLLLEAVLKHTNKSHPDYENLEKCVKQITIIADEVNEKIKDAENQNKVLEIQSKIEDCPDIVNPTRRYIYEGDLFKVKSVKSQTNTTYISTSDVRTHYLFNDLLIYCTKTRGKFVYKKQINLYGAKVKDIKEDSDKPFCFKIMIDGENSHVIRAQSESAKLEWMSKLEQSIFALKNISRGSYKHLYPIQKDSD
ncbi:hypothetical protein Glove_140g139 [Diversispora epigaea]|uniref:DH domain-containing protein n=1 Tax=Diversispora epigaea TaxID=1348612 RepID=A0A397J1H7_9GLOM|nr:hypothetical protein Glove_140g139 [Diversispora epigaea]